MLSHLPGFGPRNRRYCYPGEKESRTTVSVLSGLWNDSLQSGVKYGNTAFGIETAAGSRRSSVEFDRVLTLHPSLSAGELTLTVRNDGVDSYDVSHVGRPYFGILLAWDGDHHLFGTEHYAENDHLVTEDGYAYPGWTDQDTDPPQEEWSELPPGNSIADTYVVPEGVNDGAAVYVEVPYRLAGQQSDADDERPLLQRVVWWVTIGG